MRDTTPKSPTNNTTPSTTTAFFITLPVNQPPKLHSDQIGNPLVHLAVRDGRFEGGVGDEDGGVAHFFGHVGCVKD